MVALEVAEALVNGLELPAGAARQQGGSGARGCWVVAMSVVWDLVVLDRWVNVCAL